MTEHAGDSAGIEVGKRLEEQRLVQLAIAVLKALFVDLGMYHPGPYSGRLCGALHSRTCSIVIRFNPRPGEIWDIRCDSRYRLERALPNLSEDSPLIQQHLSPSIVNIGTPLYPVWDAQSRNELLSKIRLQRSKNPEMYHRIREDHVTAEIQDGRKATVFVLVALVSTITYHRWH
ncbi:hypothetical protein LTR56_021055 [Elasticomyces elasticus]|nr:hypothetical protein LTR56_021055 [Elasticomyces elasticus]KAK3635268.1 hypothetical protein LTR22_019264 [Elasticomyces elasticus]KAK4911638.1 hypothetical protein LTR49_019802 [Elasticomyces elasticus]KAK5748913.1 hypothetical protein LTS12_021018 [Elasticomyces elasticus]